MAKKLWLATCLAMSVVQRADSMAPPPVNPLDPHKCSQYGTCQTCAEKQGHDGDCAWCANGADGGGVCQSAHGAWESIPGCQSDMWHKSCCASHTDCASCRGKHSGDCRWCDGGSKVNGGKCLPYSGSMQPQLGGCDDGFYRPNCCREAYKTCNECKSGGDDCGWCKAGSSTNSAQCLPVFGAMQPAYGGCSDGYWDKYLTCPNDVPCGKHCLNRRPGKDGCDSKVNHTDGKTVGVCTKCDVGFYGEDCGSSCHKECLVGCDKDSGACFGCLDGLCGDTCQDNCTAGWELCKTCDQGCGKCTSCPKGTYDMDSQCSKTCGQCVGFDCDDRVGQCKGKCLLGWSGMNCDKPCTATCTAPKVCLNNACVCGPGYDAGPLGTCVASGSKPSCETCRKLVEAAKTLTEIAKKYTTYKEAEEALKAVSCFFLPGPLGIGCAAIITTETLGVFIVGQVSEKLLTEGFCVSWGLCPAEAETVI